MNVERYQKAAQNALFSQGASNLRGLLAAIPEVRETLLERAKEIKNQDTDWFNKHPIMYLFSVQIAFLTGACAFADGDYQRMQNICAQIADGNIPEGF